MKNIVRLFNMRQKKKVIKVMQSKCETKDTTKKRTNLTEWGQPDYYNTQDRDRLVRIKRTCELYKELQSKAYISCVWIKFKYCFTNCFCVDLNFTQNIGSCTSYENDITGNNICNAIGYIWQSSISGIFAPRQA
jgi:hypothetical protein